MPVRASDSTVAQQRQILEVLSLVTLDNAKQWTVYILRCADDSLYTGITTDLQRRLSEHNESPRGASYTRGRRPVALAYQHEVDNRAIASRLEYWIKSQDRPTKESIISQKTRLPEA